MANSELIDTVVDRAAVSGQITQTDTELKALNQTLLDTLRGANQLNAALGQSKTFKEIQQNADKAQLSLLRVQKAEAQLAIAQQNVEKATAQRIATEQRLENQQTKTAKATAESTREYIALRKEYDTLFKTAQDVGVKFGENSSQFKTAADAANNLRVKLDAVNHPLGNFKDQVGNYQKGFSGLSNAFNQITREFPAFANSVQTGLLGISNNIPAVFDEISRVNKVLKETNIAQAAAAGQQAKETALAGGASEEAASQVGDLAKANALAAAEGKRGAAAFRAIGQSLFTFGTLLSIGVTLLTVYGAQLFEFIGTLFKGKDALDEFAEKQKSLNDAFSSSDYKDSIKSFAEITTNIKLAKEGFLDKDLVLKQFNETLGKTTGHASDFNEAEKITLERGAKVVQLMVLKASAQSLLAKASEKASEAAIDLNKSDEETLTFGDKLSQSFKFTNGIFETEKEFRERRKKEIPKFAAERRALNQAEFKKDQDLYLKAFADVQKQAADFAKDNKLNFTPSDVQDSKGDSPAAQAIKLKIAQLRNIQDANKAIVDDEKQAFSRRISALSSYNLASKQLIELDRDLKIQDTTLTATQIETIDVEAKGEQLKRAREYKIELSKIKDSSIKELIDLEKEYNIQIKKAREDDAKNQSEILKNSLAVADQFREQELSQSQADNDQSLLDLADLYTKGLITAKQYAKQKADIETQAQINSDQVLIAALQLRIGIEQALGADTLKDEEELEKAKRKLAKDTAAVQISEAEKVAARQKQLHDKEKELADKAANFVFSLVDAGYERRKNEIQDKKDALDVDTQNQIDAENRSLDSTSQKADKINIINAQAASKKALLDQQQRKAEQDKARFDKAVAIAKAIESTAVAVTEALPNIPLSILVGAIGAIEIATIAAQPIPKYAKGTKSKPTDGPMLVGEAGSELVINPDGSRYITQRPMLTYGAKGTEVIPHMQLMGMMRTGEIKVKDREVIDMRGVIKAIKEQKAPRMVVNVRSDERYNAKRKTYWN